MTVIMVCLLSAAAQSGGSGIENIRTEMTEKALVVRYDLMAEDSGSAHEIVFTVVDNRGNAIYPDSVYGDLGKGILAGRDKMITWEIHKEFDVVYGGFTPILTIDPGTVRSHDRGPEYAALSLLMPGLGDYFVADPDEMVIKPWHKTVFTAGVLGISWLAMEKRIEIPEVTMPPGWYYYFPSPDAQVAELTYIDHEWVKEPARTEYWLFDHDAEIILGIGIASWIFDVIWATRKGAVNNRVHRTIRENASLVPVREGIYLSYTFKF